MNITILLIILMLVVFIIIGIMVYYRETKTTEDPEKATISLPHAIKTGEWDNSVTLKCSNIQLAYGIVGTILWTFAILLAVMDATAIKNPDISGPAKEFVDFVTDFKPLRYVPIAFIFALLYFVYSRTKITWSNGVLIDDKPVAVLYFDIKKFWRDANVIYLQSANQTWLLSPATSQDNIKFKNLEILKKEQAFNEAQVKQLRINLLNAGAVEQKTGFFTPFIKFGFLAFIIAIIVALLIFR